MRVLAVGPVVEPPHKVKTLRAVQGQLVAVEHVEQQRQVAVGSKLVGDELAVLPDADDVRDEQDAGALVLLVGGRGCEVGVVLAGDPDRLAGGGATGGLLLAAIASCREVRHGRGAILVLDTDGAASRGGVGGHDGGIWSTRAWSTV